MERNLTRTRGLRIALIVAVALCGAATRAQAGLIASDSYVTGTDPTMGQYVAGNSLSNYNGNPGQPSNLTNTGFVNGGYNGGTGTSNFIASSTGLVSATDGADSTSSGSVAWIGALGTTVKSDARNLSSFVEGSTGTYWMSMLVSNTGASSTTDGWVLSGFGGTTAPTYGNTTAYLQGIYFGFSDDSGTANEADLVLRYRSTDTVTNGGKTASDQILVNGANNATAGQTYLVVAEVNVNSNGSHDAVTYWVNPTDLSSVAGLTSTSQASGTLDTYAFQGSATGNGDFVRMNYAAYDYNNTAFFDEARLGTTLDSIAPAVAAVPEPTSVVLTALGGGLFGLATLRRRRQGR